MPTPEKIYMNKQSVNDAPLSSSGQAFYNWYLKNDRDDRRRFNIMEDMDEFTDLYTQDEIIKDKQWAQEQNFRQNRKDFTERAEIAEYVMKIFARDSEWFGDDSIIAPTSKYDDYKNGTDFVVEWENPETGERDIALAVDVTVTSTRSVLQDKLNKTKKGLENGTLTKIKYFNSEIYGSHEKLSLTPRVIIVFNKNDLDSLCEELVNYTKNTTDSTFFNQTRDHYMSLFVLKTTKTQLEEQLGYIGNLELVKQNPGLYSDAKHSIQRTLEKVSQELKKKEKSLSEEKVQQAYNILEKVNFSNML
jgi:hypothetical protein